MPRKLSDQAKVEAVTQRLREMFEALEKRPIPDRLMSVVDQLDDGEDRPMLAARMENRRVTAG
jgi:hypothetical protein